MKNKPLSGGEEIKFMDLEKKDIQGKYKLNLNIDRRKLKGSSPIEDLDQISLDFGKKSYTLYLDTTGIWEVAETSIDEKHKKILKALISILELIK